MAARAMLKRRTGGTEVAFRYDRHDVVGAREGDSVSLALLGAGHLATSRSLKYRRPRGAFCLGGDCGTCLIRIDGQPNVRACITPLRHGMQVQRQNVVGPPGLDPTGLIDKMLAGGMDHHHFMVRPRIANKAMQEIARRLTGLGNLPDDSPEHVGSHHEHAVDVLIVGLGSAGRAALTTLTTHGITAAGADRLDQPWRDDDDRPRLADGAMTNTGVFACYTGEGLWAAFRGRAPGPTELHTFRPRHVILATGCRDSVIPISNNDVPGVVAARGLVRQLRRADARLDVPCVVVGTGQLAQQHAAELGGELIDPAQIVRITGNNAVDAVELKDGTVDCRLVAVAASPSPAHDLPRQAGAVVRYDGTGYAAVRDGLGRCVLDDDALPAPWVVWASGDVCGYVGPRAAAEDGRRVAGNVVAALEGGS